MLWQDEALLVSLQCRPLETGAPLDSTMRTLCGDSSVDRSPQAWAGRACGGSYWLELPRRRSCLCRSELVRPWPDGGHLTTLDSVHLTGNMPIKLKNFCEMPNVVPGTQEVLS